MNKKAKFWDKIAEKYSKQPVADEVSYQKKLQVTREYFRPDMEVFEFGCGTGSTAIAHAPYVKHIRAIDISSKMIEIAKGKAGANNITNVSFEQATLDDVSISDGSIDVVLALSILHLLENKDQAISKVHSILKPGGIFVTSTACLADFKGMLKLVTYILPIAHLLGLVPMVKVFGSDELKQALINAGFEIDYQWLPGKNKAEFIIAKKIAV